MTGYFKSKKRTTKEETFFKTLETEKGLTDFLKDLENQGFEGKKFIDFKPFQEMKDGITTKELLQGLVYSIDTSKYDRIRIQRIIKRTCEDMNLIKLNKQEVNAIIDYFKFHLLLEEMKELDFNLNEESDNKLYFQLNLNNIEQGEGN